jgi:hypothetical protein
MDEQYWDALTSRIQSAESFLRKSSYSHSPNLIDREQKALNDRDTFSESDREHLHSEQSVTRSTNVTPTYFRAHQATLDQLNSTIEDGRMGFKNLIHLNNMVVLMGLVLIGLSAISGIILLRETLTFIFGGLGISVLVAMFVLKPSEKIQVALANLIQAQTVSLDFYNQLQFWTPYAHEASGTEERQQASKALHDATTFALKALHDYVEPSSYGEKRIK